MAFRGNNHGWNGKTAKECQKMQNAFIQAKIEGKNHADAAREAGYAPSVVSSANELASSLQDKIRASLKARGIDEDKLAEEYAEGIVRSKLPGAKEADHNAHAKYLLQIGYLLGHGKQSPQVAVQINNGNDKGEVALNVIGRIELLAGLIAEEISAKQSSGLSKSSDNSVDTEVQAHPGVVRLGGDGEEVVGRGQP